MARQPGSVRWQPAVRRSIGATAGVAALVATILAARTIAAPGSPVAQHPPPAAAIATPSASPASPAPAGPSSTADSPTIAPSPARSAGPAESLSPGRTPVDISLAPEPGTVFASEATQYMCAAAALQMTLNVVGPKVDTSVARQRSIYAQASKFTTVADSRNGGWGPAGMAAFLTHAGSPYRLVVYRTRDAALRAAGTALATRRRPVILMAWWGAHAWVMSGIRADADPAAFADFHLLGAYILDPWYPRVSSIWGRSAAPGAFHDMANIAHNFIGWKRPEAFYPGRDGRFLVILPVASGPAGQG